MTSTACFFDMRKPAALLCAIVFAVVSTLVLSQAPEDTEGHTCSQLAVPQGMFRLLDSSWYKLLLPSSSSASAGWTQTPAKSWTEGGSFCSRTLRSCGKDDGWIVTQYIHKSADVSYPLGITVEIKGDIHYNCVTDPKCSTSIKVYYYPSSGAISNGRAVNTLTDEYQLIGTLSFSYNSALKSLSFSLGSEFDRFYIAIRQQNSCFTLRKLQVSYKVCPSSIEGKVIYPQTAIGSSAIPAEASCTIGSKVAPGGSLNVTCNTDGTYSGTPSCSCAGGYFDFHGNCFACAAGSFSNDGDTSCTPCPENSSSKPASKSCDCNAGYYEVNKACEVCPANSQSLESGATVCDCVSEYYRTSYESVSDPCTTAPTTPLLPTLIECDDATATINWTAPLNNGGRTDGFYITGYKTAEGNEFIYYSSGSPLTATHVTITGLQPLTTYVVVVVAENGITQEYDRFSLTSRTSSPLTFTTKEGVPSAPAVKVLGRGSVLVWAIPEMPNGVIKAYEIKMIGDGGSENSTKVDAVTFYYEPSLDDLPHGSNITVQIRGVTDVGPGDWSLPVTFLESVIHCIDNSDHAPTVDNCADNTGDTQEPDSCSCPAGYEMTCTNINECLSDNGGCNHTCIDTEGSYLCGCPAGYQLSSDQTTCIDINECADNQGGCSDFCTNTDGSYQCSCQFGYTLGENNKDCVDVDECATNDGGCSNLCINTIGSYHCSCPVGYQLAESGNNCVDINECLSKNGVCSQHCDNTEGSYSCSCWEGYQLEENGKDCADINECASKNGGCNHTCSNLEGSYECSCREGYRLEGNGKECTDVNECASKNGGCNHTCSNLEGSYECSCREGYRLERNGKDCADIDECASKNKGCDHTCSNIQGSYECSCREGYRLEGNGKDCADIDECASRNGGCNHTCSNLIGSYECSCLDGYALSANLKDCVNTNECTVNNGGCSHICTDSEGSFVCSCPVGYELQGNGLDCIATATAPPTHPPTAPSCGGQLTTTTGAMSIPATVAGLSADCTWIIKVPDAKKIVTLTIDVSKSGPSGHSSYDCPDEYVAVFNGKGTDSVLLNTYCLDSLPSTISSSTNALTLHYHANTQSPLLKSDLKISYTSADPPTVRDGCSEFLNAGQIFASPGFPEPYSSVRKCYYRIYGSGHYQFKLLYTDLNCTTEDKIMVYDGISEYYPLILEIGCPKNVSTEMMSTNSLLTVVFDQRTTNTFKGFQGVFVTV